MSKPTDSSSGWLWPVTILLIAGMFLYQKFDFNLSPTGISGSFEKPNKMPDIGFLAMAKSKEGSAERPTETGLNSLPEAHTPEPEQRKPVEHQAAIQKAAPVVNSPVKTLLWIDDHPEYNLNLRKNFKAAGFQVVLSTDSIQADEMLRTRHFDAIISDIGRPRDPLHPKAGVRYLQKIRREGNTTRYYLYSPDAYRCRNVAAYLAEGAQGSTNKPDKLFELVAHLDTQVPSDCTP